MKTNNDIKMLMQIISPHNFHNTDSTDMQTALEQFGDTAMLETYKQIQSKTKRLNYLMTIYLTNRPENGKVPRNHPLYKLYCRLLSTNLLLADLLFQYVKQYNFYADQYKLPKY